MSAAHEEPRHALVADRGDRLQAALIDLICVWMLLIPASSTVLPPWLALVDVAIVAWVQGYLLVTRGQTIGKSLCDVRIVSAEGGGRVGFVSVVVQRFVAPLGIIALAQQPDALVRIADRRLDFHVGGLGAVLLLLDLLAIFGPDRRCLHDYLAGTKVVRCAKKTARKSERAAERAAPG